MCTTLSALALIVYMEGRGEPDITKTYLTSFAIEKAEKLKKPVCDTLKIPGLYSWNWDGVNTPVDKTFVKENIEPVVLKELKRSKRSLTGYSYFNKCSGKKFKTGKMLKSNNVCFY